MATGNPRNNYHRIQVFFFPGSCYLCTTAPLCQPGWHKQAPGLIYTLYHTSSNLSWALGVLHKKKTGKNKVEGVGTCRRVDRISGNSSVLP